MFISYLIWISGVIRGWNEENKFYSIWLGNQTKTYEEDIKKERNKSREEKKT